MKLPEFKLERYFARNEFSAPYLLCCSDCESFSVGEILALEGEDALSSFSQLPLSYTDSQGNPELRGLIASLYRQIQSGQVLVTSGAEEAIFIFMNTALDPGDHVIVQWPCYQSLFEIARSIGCQVSRWECREENNWRPDPEELAQAVKPNTRAIIINSPHNPTGRLMTTGDLNFLVDLARKRELLLFSDEVYRFLEYDRDQSPVSACDLYENAVSLGVMSKSYGLAGLRIGWVATRNTQIYNKMAAFKDYTSICNSAPGEYLASLALKHGERLIGRNLAIIKENLNALDRFFARYADLFSWTRPGAGPIAFPGIRWEGSDSDQFCSDLLRTKGVLLAPSSQFDHGSGNFRIGFGRKNLPEALARLEEYVRERFIG